MEDASDGPEVLLDITEDKRQSPSGEREQPRKNSEGEDTVQLIKREASILSIRKFPTMALVCLFCRRPFYVADDFVATSQRRENLVSKKILRTLNVVKVRTKSVFERI